MANLPAKQIPAAQAAMQPKRGKAAAAAMTPEQKAAKQAEKRARFIKVCGGRVAKALKDIELIGRCSGNNYVFTEDDVRKIRDAVGRAVNDMLGQFKPRDASKAAGPGFSFDAPAQQG